MITEEWLNKINSEFSMDNMPHIKRPFEALRIYSVEFGCSISFNSDLAKFVFNWFYRNTKSDAHKLGPIYISTFFYDGEFWDLDIPQFFGTVNLDPYNSLKNMPESIQERLAKNSEESTEYLLHWADCFDFGLGFDVVGKSDGLNEFGSNFLKAGYEELSSAASLLRAPKVNPRAVMDARLAVEMFFKAYAGLNGQLAEKEAMRMSHHLEKGLKKMVDVSGDHSLAELEPKLSIFPEISDRYKAQTMSNGELWECFQLAQHIGALVLRNFSGYDALSDIKRAISSKKSRQSDRL